MGQEENYLINNGVTVRCVQVKINLLKMYKRLNPTSKATTTWGDFYGTSALSRKARFYKI
jgi:hypothetical protein